MGEMSREGSPKTFRVPASLVSKRRIGGNVLGDRRDDSLISASGSAVLVPQAFSFVPPMSGDFSRGFVKPVVVRGQPNHLNRRKPFWGVGCRVAERRQFSRRHQDLDVVFGKAQELRRRIDIQTSRKVSASPRCHYRLR